MKFKLWISFELKLKLKLTRPLYPIISVTVTIKLLKTSLPPYCAFYQTSWQLSTVEIFSTGPVGPICCVRHSRPRHSAAEVTDKLRHWRCCPQVVLVVPDQPYPVCPSWYGLIDHCSADMWCSTGLGAWANFVHHVYRWPGFTHPAALPVAAPLRWWHSD